VQALPDELSVGQPLQPVAFAGRAGRPLQLFSPAGAFFLQLPNAFPHAPREHVARREPTYPALQKATMLAPSAKLAIGGQSLVVLEGLPTGGSQHVWAFIQLRTAWAGGSGRVDDGWDRLISVQQARWVCAPSFL
jgi:hypothetical protein